MPVLFFLTILSTIFLAAPSAFAHFGMLIPSRTVVSEQKEARIELTLSFSHPMEAAGMHMERPKVFFVVVDGIRTDLTSILKPVSVFSKQGWSAEYTLQRPGLYQFVVEPEPYWEPAEDCYIIHYSKTYVSAFGREEDWYQPLGMKTEIVPLSRPFGNYTGNLFQGQVLLDGKPLPNAMVEIEYDNEGKKYRTPNDSFLTQVVRADGNGIFSYAIPFAGWWGFAALSTSKEKIDHNGNPKDVELGAILWAQFLDPLKN